MPTAGADELDAISPATALATLALANPLLLLILLLKFCY
jgi:hypothetical protein